METMEIKNNLFWVATLQDLGKPYADLYFDKEKNELFLFVRVSKAINPESRFAAMAVTPKQVKEYINSRKPIAEIFSYLPFKYASIKDKRVSFEDEQYLTSSSTFQYNQPFDPMLCNNKVKLNMLLRRMSQNQMR